MTRYIPAGEEPRNNPSVTKKVEGYFLVCVRAYQALRTGLKNPKKRTSISFLKRVLTRPRTTGERDLNATLFIRLITIYRDIGINPQDGQRRAKELGLIRRPSLCGDAIVAMDLRRIKGRLFAPI
jgi:hypothetical protein